MSRTRDLVLARLRLIAMRWQGEWDSVEQAGALEKGPPREPGEGVPGEGVPGEGEPGDGEFGEGELGLPGRPGSVNAQGESAWPAPIPWLRLVALLVLVVALGCAALTYVAWPREQSSGAPATQTAPGGAELFADPFPPTSPSPSASVLVHVVGEVRHPGVVRLPAGSRVVDAVKEAGGLRRGGRLGSTNLARVLIDGERVEVGAVQAPGSVGSVGAGVASSGPLDLNTATAEQLDTLPGIGPVTAAKILGWRTTNGRFTAVDELAEVPGIGPKTLAELRPHVRV